MRRRRVLIVGCGDVGERVARLLLNRVRVLALTSRKERVHALRALGVTPLLGDLDDPATLGRLAGLAQDVLHLAPPPGKGRHDTRTAALLHALGRRAGPTCMVYGSTSGIYGDAGGARFDETRPPAPATDRAHRRLDAEKRLRTWGRTRGTRVGILRIPGIYAADRAGGARERLLKASPVLRPEDDVHTNHIHADDLARACLLALFRIRAQRVLHTSDDSELKMGDYFDRAADLLGLPRPPRISREDAHRVLTPLQLSFMGESRRLDNRRMKRELRLRLLCPTVDEGLTRLPAGPSAHSAGMQATAPTGAPRGPAGKAGAGGS